MATITIPGSAAMEVEAQPCAVCGRDATRAETPLCSEHNRAWIDSADCRLAWDLEGKLRAGFAAKVKIGGAP